MELTLSIEDMATPFLEDIINNKPQWFGSALKSTGWWAQHQIKTGIRANAPGGKPYLPTMKASRRREIDDGMMDGWRNHGRRAKRSYPILGKLRTAVGYDKTKVSDGIVKIGWLSNSAVRLGTWHEKGITQTVSEKMRRMFFAAGIGLKKGRATIALPVRQTYQPMVSIIQRDAPAFMEQKIISYMQGNSARSSSRRNRKYRVYG